MATPNWPLVSLGDICEFRYGKSLPSAKRAGGDVPVFGSNGQVGTHHEALTSGPSIVIGRKGSFGEINFSEKSCWPIDTTYFVDATTTRANLRWLALRLAALPLKSLNKAAAIPGLNRDDAYSQQLLLPPPEEQRRIAEVLDRAEALRAKRRAALAQLDTLTHSIFLDLFGDPATNPKRWPRTRLGELLVDGPQNGLYKPSSDYGSGAPIVRIDAFYDGAVTKLADLRRLRVSDREKQLYGLRADDILVNRVNSIEYLGKCALIPPLAEETVFESNMMRFAVDRERLEPRYLVQFLQSGFVKSQILTGAKHAVNQASINQQDIKNFQINVPPLTFQKDFIRRVRAVERIKSAQRRSLTELDALFASLQHRAFRGEL